MLTHSIVETFKNKKLINQNLVIQGWVKTRRDSKGGFSFIELNDGSCFKSIQVVADQTLSNYEDELLKLSSGCSLKVSGMLVESSGKNQSVELQASKIEVLGWVEEPEGYPISKKRHSFEFLRTVAHLRPRTNTFGAMTRIRHRLAQSIHSYFDQQGFYWINTPIITASDCEGAGELFRVSTLDQANLPRLQSGDIDYSQDFFDQETFLTVSGQLQAETHCLAMSKVYTFGPTFRAENSNTSRHLAEFWMIEPEIAFAQLDDLTKLTEDFLKMVLNQVREHCEEDLAFFNQFIDKSCLARLNSLISDTFEIMDYSEAVTILEKSGQSFEHPVAWGLDLQSEHERYITEQHVKKPTIVQNYPAEIKAFYMRLNEDGKTCAAMDVLAPGIGEIIGGSQREERLTVLDSRMDPKVREHLNWYRDLRRYGTVPHAGFGLGFERLLNYITGMENIRDAIPFPRAPGLVGF